MEKEKILKYIPILSILTLWIVFTTPYLVKLKVPYPSEHQVNSFAPWSMYKEMWGPVKNNAIPDVITEIYPWKQFTIQEIKKGRLPLWNPYNFAGTPHLANYQSAVFFPGNLIFFVLPMLLAWSIQVLLQPLIAAIGIYIIARSLKIGKTGSVLSAFSFMFCGFITGWMPYGTLGYAIIPLPYLLYCANKFYDKQKTRHLIATCLLVTCALLAGHFQTSLYCLLTLGAYIIYLAWKTREIKRMLLLIASALSGILIASIQLAPTIELYTQSARSTTFEIREAIPLKYLPTIFAPDFYGNPVSRNDFFGHYAEWSAYAGTISVSLALISILRKKEVFFIALAIISLLAAYATPLGEFIVWSKFPVLSTSAQSRVIVLFSFSIAILAGTGVDEIKKIIANKDKKFLAILSIIWLGSAMLLLIAARVVSEQPTISLRNTIIPCALLILVICITWLAYIKRKYQIYILLLLPLLVAFEMLRFTTKWMPQDSPKHVFPKLHVTSEFEKMSPYRAVANMSPEYNMFYDLQMLTGYDPLYPKRYGEFVGYMDKGKLEAASRTLLPVNQSGKYMSLGLEMLSVKYIIHKDEDTGEPWSFPFSKYPKGSFKQIFNDNTYQIYDTDIEARAKVFYNYAVKTNDKDILYEVFNENQNKVILEQNPGIESLNAEATVAKIISYEPNQVILVADTPQPGVLFLPDSYYPGWEVYVNNEKTNILRANYAFRGVVVPKGESSVKFVYRPQVLVFGAVLSLVGLLGITGVILVNRKK